LDNSCQCQISANKLSVSCFRPKLLGINVPLLRRQKCSRSPVTKRASGNPPLDHLKQFILPQGSGHG